MFWQPQSLNTLNPIFDDSPLHQFTKYSNFLLDFKLLSLPWKLDNLYYYILGAREAHFHRATNHYSKPIKEPVIAKFAEIQSPLRWTRPMPQVTHVFQVFSINTKMHFVLWLFWCWLGVQDTKLFPCFSPLRFCGYGPVLE